MQVIVPDNGKGITVRGEDEYYLYGANGNIIGTVGDKKIQHDDNNDGIIDRYTADVRTATMYSSYGAMSKSFNGSSLSLGFNSQRRSPEISATAQTAEFWEYDADVARRWNVDPVYKHSPYEVFGSNPIWLSDYNGADTTLPDAGGKNLTLPTGATGINTFDGTVKDLQNSSVKVQPVAGSLSSFNINGKQFNAQFGSRSGSFQGYYSDDISYNDYAAQQASSGVQTAGVAGTLTGVGSGGATGAALPALPLAGFQIGWNYGATHADKVTSWVTAIASTVGGWLGEDVVADNPTAIAPPPLPIMLYRGVHFGHPDYYNALMGIATPAGGFASAEDHTGGNFNSMYTSWSMFRTVADFHANKSGPGGIVLQKAFLPGQFLPNISISDEGEFLVPGKVTGAIPGPPLGPGNSTGY
ncbi:MAG: hypothetical protein IPJ81_08670 [Chitinophagaceae bacterium]|nr:hypothetical protein [Chitinophagaceae bacterium]